MMPMFLCVHIFNFIKNEYLLDKEMNSCPWYLIENIRTMQQYAPKNNNITIIEEVGTDQGGVDDIK